MALFQSVGSRGAPWRMKGDFSSLSERTTRRVRFGALLARLLRIEEAKHVGFTKDDARSRGQFDRRAEIHFLAVDVTHAGFAARLQMNDAVRVHQDAMFRFDVRARQNNILMNRRVRTTKATKKERVNE